MSDVERSVVVAVCGSPGAGKTTVAAAAARRLGIPLLTRDEFKTGLGLSSGSPDEAGGVELHPDFHIAGGPFSRRAEAVMVDAARLLAAAGVSFVVESSVLSDELLSVLRAVDARVVAVSVVADQQVIARRLDARLADGGAVAEQLAAQLRSGAMARSIFEPPPTVDAVIEVDTSDDGPPPVDAMEEAFLMLLR